MPLDGGLVFVAVVPDRALATSKARQALPHEVSRGDATFNLGRMALLLAGLADRSLLIREATEDRLHQDYRSPLFPEAPQFLSRLLGVGALATCWSGAGPSVIGICDANDGEGVRDAAEAAMADIGVAGRALLLRADVEGLTVNGVGSRLPRSHAPYDILAEGPDADR
jgi:homoserine kinase